MPIIDAVKRAFISYSRTDGDFVNTLAHDLRAAGIQVWVDFEGLVPGTRDWEAAVRKAVTESFALLFVATPESRASEYVRSEILLAQAQDLPLYALWAGGKSWIDSVPMTLAHIQYQDFRREAYHTSLARLVDELSRRGDVLPNLPRVHGMLREIVTSQPPRESHRRWFSDDDFDLVVWFDDVGAVAGFQLCYDRSTVERALTWTTLDGYRHCRVDTGEATPLKNLTPLLVSSTDFAGDRVIAGFVEAANALEPTNRSFVIQRLQEVSPCERR